MPKADTVPATSAGAGAGKGGGYGPGDPAFNGPLRRSSWRWHRQGRRPASERHRAVDLVAAAMAPAIPIQRRPLRRHVLAAARRTSGVGVGGAALLENRRIRPSPRRCREGRHQGLFAGTGREGLRRVQPGRPRPLASR
jgi:hypothetical protein